MTKIYFKGERQGYVIQAMSKRYWICTKPFNPKRTYLYCIVDLEKGIRGPDNYRCLTDYRNVNEAKNALIELENGNLEISHRNRVALEITRIRLEKGR